MARNLEHLNQVMIKRISLMLILVASLGAVSICFFFEGNSDKPEESRVFHCNLTIDLCRQIYVPEIIESGYLHRFQFGPVFKSKPKVLYDKNREIPNVYIGQDNVDRYSSFLKENALDFSDEIATLWLDESGITRAFSLLPRLDWRVDFVAPITIENGQSRYIPDYFLTRIAPLLSSISYDSNLALSFNNKMKVESVRHLFEDHGLRALSFGVSRIGVGVMNELRDAAKHGSLRALAIFDTDSFVDSWDSEPILGIRGLAARVEDMSILADLIEAFPDLQFLQIISSDYEILHHLFRCLNPDSTKIRILSVAFVQDAIYHERIAASQKTVPPKRRFFPPFEDEPFLSRGSSLNLFLVSQYNLSDIDSLMFDTHSLYVNSKRAENGLPKIDFVFTGRGFAFHGSARSAVASDIDLFRSTATSDE